jgi:hypothetical protein
MRAFESELACLAPLPAAARGNGMSPPLQQQQQPTSSSYHHHHHQQQQQSSLSRRPSNQMQSNNGGSGALDAALDLLSPAALDRMRPPPLPASIPGGGSYGPGRPSPGQHLPPHQPHTSYQQQLHRNQQQQQVGPASSSSASSYMWPRSGQQRISGTGEVVVGLGGGGGGGRTGHGGGGGGSPGINTATFLDGLAPPPGPSNGLKVAAGGSNTGGALPPGVTRYSPNNPNRAGGVGSGGGGGGLLAGRTPSLTRQQAAGLGPIRVPAVGVGAGGGGGGGGGRNRY